MFFNKAMLVLLVLVFSVILISTGVYAQNFSGYEPRGFFNNYTTNEDWGIEGKLRQIEQEATAEIAIVLVNNIGDSQWLQQWFNTWQIGKDCGNGLLLLVATETKQLVILPGPAILISDEEIKETGNKVLKSFSEDTGRGLHELTDQFWSVVRSGPRGQRSPSAHGFFGGGQTNRQPIIFNY